MRVNLRVRVSSIIKYSWKMCARLIRKYTKRKCFCLQILYLIQREKLQNKYKLTFVSQQILQKNAIIRNSGFYRFRLNYRQRNGALRVTHYSRDRQIVTPFVCALKHNTENRKHAK